MGGLRADVDGMRQDIAATASAVREIQMVGQQLSLTLRQVEGIIAQHRADKAELDALRVEQAATASMAQASHKDIAAAKQWGVKGALWALGVVAFVIGASIKWGIPALWRWIWTVKTGQPPEAAP